jgi:hypothetical protein
MDEIFIVVQRGVYRHNIVGASMALDGAIEVAVEALKTERDAYHRYEIVKCPVGKVDSGGGETVYEISRKMNFKTGNYEYIYN